MYCTVNSTSSLEISEFVVVADRSTLSQFFLRTTYVYDIQSGSRLVPQTTGNGNAYFHCNLPCVKAVWPSFSAAKFQCRDATHSPKCGCSALTCPHQAHKANARLFVTELFSLSNCTHTVREKGKMKIWNQVWDILWCLVSLHAPESKGISWPGSNFWKSAYCLNYSLSMGQIPGVVVLDNASIHHAQGIVEFTQSKGTLVQFLPPYIVRLKSPCTRVTE